MTAIYVSDLFKEKVPNWLAFYDDFHDYVFFDDLPPYFGRDEAYQDELWHLHLAADDDIIRRWSFKRRQYDRTTPVAETEEEKALDKWLLYAWDKFEDRYLLLTILDPDAHNGDRWGSYIRQLKDEIINPWIVGKIKYDPIP